MSEADSPLLEVHGPGQELPGRARLDDVNLTVTRGQVHLIGQNGADVRHHRGASPGWSSPPPSEVRFEGEPLPVGDPNASIARGIATIYQELDLVPHLSSWP